MLGHLMGRQGSVEMFVDIDTDYFNRKPQLGEQLTPAGRFGSQQ